MRAALLCLLSVCFNMEPPEALPDVVIRHASAFRLMQNVPVCVQQKLGFISQTSSVPAVTTSGSKAFVCTRPKARSRTIRSSGMIV